MGIHAVRQVMQVFFQKKKKYPNGCMIYYNRYVIPVVLLPSRYYNNRDLLQLECEPAMENGNITGADGIKESGSVHSKVSMNVIFGSNINILQQK